MSSDDYFGDEDLDQSTIAQLDALEAAYIPSPSRPDPTPLQPPKKPGPIPSSSEGDSFYDLTLDIDENDLQQLDDDIEVLYKAPPVSRLGRTTSENTVQTTLFGGIANVAGPSSNKSRPPLQVTRSNPRNPFGQQAPKTKKWDHTEFAKTGIMGPDYKKKGKGKGKGKGRANFDEGEEDEEENVEFEQFPAPFVSNPSVTFHSIFLLFSVSHSSKPLPMKSRPDLLEAKHWIYPLNRPKRDYQFNIVKHCLFENTIVALPTGLGKTFVAGVVMLNYFRWYPEGKIVFVAPTKPLVAQQIEACHQTCGIPGRDAVEMTGSVLPKIRAANWVEKRIFYMTPETLINDLTKEACDARDIVLIVMDEAHRATSSYAYTQVVRFMMAKNPHFRLLALTATPGGTPDAVQTLIDALHISHIEIRDENSLDLKPYIYAKRIEQHIITMTESIDRIRDALSAYMDTLMKPLKQSGILFPNLNPTLLHSFLPQKRISELRRDQGWARVGLSQLASLARAMGYLVEGTVGMCYTYLQGLIHQAADEMASEPNKAASSVRKMTENPQFQTIMRELEGQRSTGFEMHPKMDRLKTLIVQHFASAMGDDGGTETETRVMVFVTFRDVVDEIVETLNAERPLIRAHRFIGQGTDKAGKRGITQKEQLELIQKFKKGELNVLVATSIGEEGLDIGEVDLIVCYDAQKTPIRMLQRAGRTGRKREGTVQVLLAEGREEANWDKAKMSHKEVQKTIWKGDQLQLFGDVPRLLPEHIKPVCLEKVMEIQEFVREEKPARSLTASKSSKGTKRKRDDNIHRNIPTGASTGFVSVAQLLVKGDKGGRKKQRIAPPKDFDEAAEDDDTDLDIELGSVFAPPRRTQSSKNAVSSSSTSKAKVRKTKSTDATTAKRKRKATKPEPAPSSSQFTRMGEDDSDDLDIERGIIDPTFSQTTTSGGLHDVLTPTEPATSSPLTPAEFTRISPRDRSTSGPLNVPREPKDLTREDSNMAWLIDEDDDFDIEILDSSPLTSKKALPPSTEPADELVMEIPSSPARKQEVQTPAPADESVMEISETAFTASHKPPSQQRKPASVEDSIEFVGPPVILPGRPFSMGPPRNPSNNGESSHVTSTPARNYDRANLVSSPSSGHDTDLSQPLRPRRGFRKRALLFDSADSPERPSRMRLQRYRPEAPAASGSTSRRKRTRKLPIVEGNPLFDMAAEHSGDEVGEGSSHSEDDVESESDRMFLKDSPITQAPPGYNQRLAYRQSLLTQAPAGAPAFADGPRRRGPFGPPQSTPPGRKFMVSSSPPRDEEPDEYAFGSFVVEDDAEISYLGD